MTDYKLPVGWKFNGSKENQTTFTGSGHMVSAPYLAIFDRVVPQSSRTGLSNPSYRVREIRGFVDSEGNPTTGRAVVEVNIRWPVGATPATVKDMITSMGSHLSDADFVQDVVDEQLLPREVSIS